MTSGARMLTLGTVLLLLVAQVGPAVATGPESLLATGSGSTLAVGPESALAVESPSALIANRDVTQATGGVVTQERGVDSREEVEAFVDAAMAEDLREHHVSGATVSVVKDGELLFSEGYGYADRRNRTPVVANRTAFRVGSVSKLVAWTAVMQQVENGTLDPNANVNRYLDRVQIPATYDEPVTLEHLATHSAGFEEQLQGVAVESPADLRPLGLTLQDVPTRVRPPGVVTSYSNYGAALAGHIAARQAPGNFSEYVERRIFDPLNMTHSTFRQPVPADLPGTTSEGYRYANGRFVRGEFETIGIPPAGSMSATATDAAKFMLAHLQEGRYRDSRILSASATERMHRQHFANHPALNGMAFGFYEQSRNGVRIIGHGGDTELFHSGLWLFPERDLGVFVSYNSVGGAAAREEFFDTFVDRFFPDEETPAASPVAATDGGNVSGGPSLSAFTGAYRSTRISSTSFEKVAALNSDFRVRRVGNETLVTSIPGQGTKRFVRTAPTVFEEVGGDGRMAFRVEDGDVPYVFFDSAAPQSFERIGWWETTTVQGGLLAVVLVVLLSAILGWPAAAVWRRWRRWRVGAIAGTPTRANGRPGSSASSPTGTSSRTGANAGGRTAGRTSDRPRAARWLAGFAGLLGIGFLAGFVVLVAADPFNVITQPASLKALLAVPLVFAVAALGVLAFAVLAWTDRYWGLLGRVHYTLLAVAFVVFLWQLSYWNLLGFWL